MRGLSPVVVVVGVVVVFDGRGKRCEESSTYVTGASHEDIIMAVIRYWAGQDYVR